MQSQVKSAPSSSKCLSSPITCRFHLKLGKESRWMILSRLTCKLEHGLNNNGSSWAALNLLKVKSDTTFCIALWEIFGNYFHFWYIFGTSWKEATAAKESTEILTGWYKNVFQTIGTGWMLCSSVVLTNGNIWVIFVPWRGRLPKKIFWSLFNSRTWLAPAQIFNFGSHQLHVFCP